MTLASILVVDADAASRSMIAGSLRKLGHDVSESGSAGAAYAAVRRNRPDLMVCDCLLPDIAGVELLNDVRRSEDLATIRILMTSARAESLDLVSSLESGADDFVSKPIDMPEFLARVEACLKRPPSNNRPSTITAGGITIDEVSQRVAVNDSFVSLAPREFRLLQFFVTHPDQVFNREQLLVRVWDRDMAVGPRTVDVHMRRLRRALEPFGCNVYLQTVRGSGYRFSLSV